MKRLRSLTAFLLSLVLALGLMVPALAQEEEVTITILETSDLHGHIYSYDYAIDAPTNNTGLTRVSTIVKQEREKDPDLILLDNGDAIQGNLISLFNNDLVHPITNVMNLLDYDLRVLGNHEFNYEFDMLTRAIDAFEGDFITANIYKADNHRWMAPYVIKEVKGVKVGIFGIVAPHVPRWEASYPDHYDNMTFTTPMEETGKMVEELREQVDVLIGAIHYGREGEYDTEGVYEVAQAYPQVDAYLIGHAHELLAEENANGTPILEPGDLGKFVSKLTLTVKKSGDGFEIVKKEYENIDSANFEEDPQIQEAMAYVHKASIKDANTVVGRVSADFLPEGQFWLPGIPYAQIQDTALMDLINQVQIHFSGADVSLAALFTTDSNLVQGDYRKKDAVNVYKYDNTLMSVKITGGDLKAIMEEYAGAYFNTYREGDVTISFNPDIRMYNYDMFAGVNYEIDISKPAGERIVNLTFNGEPLGEDRELVLALNNYRYGALLNGGLIKDENKVFDSTTAFPDTPSVRDLITVYAQEKGELTPNCDNNWKIVGADLNDEDAQLIYEMIEKGEIEIPTSEDGRTPNVQSINADDLREEGIIPPKEAKVA